MIERILAISNNKKDWVTVDVKLDTSLQGDIDAEKISAISDSIGKINA